MKHITSLIKTSMIAGACLFSVILVSNHFKTDVSQSVSPVQIFKKEPDKLLKQSLNGKKLKNHYQVFFPEAFIHRAQFVQLKHLLLTAIEGDVITIHLGGDGGRIDVFLDLYTAVKQTKAKVIMNVTSDVSSAHAFFAVSGDELIVNKYSSFMFHHSSLMSLSDKDIDAIEGTDRGISLSKKYRDYKKQSLKDFLDFIVDTEVLSAKELVLINSGHDVIIEAEVIKERFDTWKRKR